MIWSTQVLLGYLGLLQLKLLCYTFRDYCNLCSCVYFEGDLLSIECYIAIPRFCGTTQGNRVEISSFIINFRKACSYTTYRFCEIMRIIVSLFLTRVVHCLTSRAGLSSVWAFPTPETLLVILDLPLGPPMGRYFGGFLGRIFTCLTANKAGSIPPCRIPRCSCTASRCITILFAFSNVRFGSICIRSDSALSLMPTTILSLINSSVKTPNSQFSARLYTVVINCSTDSTSV